jgi:hypothetical protein
MEKLELEAAYDRVSSVVETFEDLNTATNLKVAKQPEHDFYN